MQRIVCALFCALVSHGGLLLLSWPENTQIAPQLPGAESITISFDDCTVTQQQAEQVQTSPTPSQQEATPEPPLPELENIAPVSSATLQTAGEKKIKHIRPPTRKKRLHFKQQPVQKVQSTPDHASGKPTTQKQLAKTAQHAAAAPVTSQASPLYQSNPKPVYPQLARRRGWEGVVMIKVLVLEDGSPSHIDLQQTSGYPLLDKAALKAVQKWHFVPATRDGIPVVGEVIVPVHFKLQ
ncbi:energy transducer TonB [Desulfogranum marinum]|uniref:energy transducer TonB n=1 Tax=Desulfogranum marinum TaxID=453220 RepID=UPI0029C921F1|nr:energy transducer TonB [Desulfogranum marinum]